MLNVKQRIEGDEQFLPPTHARSFGAVHGPAFGEGTAAPRGGRSFRAQPARCNCQPTRRQPRSVPTFLHAITVGWRALTPCPRHGASVSAWPAANALRRPRNYSPMVPTAGMPVSRSATPISVLKRVSASKRRLKHAGHGFNLTATLYGSRFANFLFEAPTGEIRDDLPVYQARQGRATYTGFEARNPIPSPLYAACVLGSRA